jgi:hypothetical protein
MKTTEQIPLVGFHKAPPNPHFECDTPFLLVLHNGFVFICAGKKKKGAPKKP